MGLWWRAGGLLHLTGDSSDCRVNENDDRMERNTCGFEGSGGSFAVASVKLRVCKTKVSNAHLFDRDRRVYLLGSGS